MNPLDYLRALRRRWAVVAGGVLTAVLVAVLVTSVGPVGPLSESYEATTVLLASGISSDRPFAAPDPGDSLTLETIAALVTIGDVPARAAGRIGFEGDPLELAAEVQAEIQPETGLLLVTATSEDPANAERVSDAFAQETIAFLQERETQIRLDATEAVTIEMEVLQEEIAELEPEIDAASSDKAALLTAERDAAIRRYGLLSERYRTLAAEDPSGSLSIVQSPTSQTSAEGGLEAPTTQGGWLIVAAFLGLLAGAAIALFLERYDTRIRSRDAAERHFRAPVLTEIPLMPRKDRAVPIHMWDQSAQDAEAFRVLGTTLTYWRTNGALDQEAGGNGAAPRTILLTSAGPGEGKTTVTARLAAAIGQLGKSVLVLSCDFRRPESHRLFGVSNEHGLAEALSSNGLAPSSRQKLLDGRIQETKLEGVRVVPSGQPPDRPAELLSSENMRRALEEATKLADVVLIDSAPVLVANDAAALMPEVDAVILVARAGKVDGKRAELTREVLDRLGATIAGVALNGVSRAAIANRYYGYYRYYQSGNIQSRLRALARQRPEQDGR